MAVIQRKLPVLPGGRIIVPGTEPSTTVTSTTMEVEMRKLGMPIPAIIMLKDALTLIPGSKVQLFQNFGTPVEQWFVLPEQDQTCPCSWNVDYYTMLRDAARPATEQEIQEFIKDECEVLNSYDLIYGT